MNYHHNLAKETTGEAPRGAHTTEYFEGLPEGVKHTVLIRLVQNVAKQIGLSSAAVDHLRYLVTHTRSIDWHPGAVPVVYRSVQMTAADRGRCEKQIYNIEQVLNRAGLLQWRDREDRKRFGKRNAKTKQIEYAWGVDLTPLGKAYNRLVELNERHKAYMSAWAEMKGKLSGVRRQILSRFKWAGSLSIDVQDLIERFEALPKINARMTPNEMSEIYNDARAIRSELEIRIDDRRKSIAEEVGSRASEEKESSDMSVENYRHIQPTNSHQSIYIDCNQNDDDDRKKVGENSSFGLEHISYDQVLDVASDEFVEHIKPSAASDPYADLVRAAIARCHELGIGRFAWLKATAVMGETAAAVAVIIIDRNRAHPLIPVVNPGGVLRGMTAKAQNGELHLHRSIFAILKRDSEDHEVRC